MKAYYVTETNDLCRLTIISNESLLKTKNKKKNYQDIHFVTHLRKSINPQC